MTTVERAELQQHVQPGANAGCVAELADKVIRPPAQALVVGGGLAFGVFLLSVWDRRLIEAFEICTKVFGLSTVISLPLAYAGPGLLDVAHHWLDREPPIRPDGAQRKLEREPIINRRGNRKALGTHGEKMARARSLFKAPKRRVFKQSVAPVAVGLDVRDFYDVTTVMHTHHADALTRRAFEREFHRGQSLYREYVGTWQEPGLWREWRVIEEKDRRGTCRFVCDLDDILKMNRALWWYARAQGYSPTEEWGEE
jgi:hypothetical protein